MSNVLKASDSSMRTTNKIRQITDKIDLNECNKEKEVITLSIGDPTVFGNLNLNEKVKESIIKSLNEGYNNGYTHSTGSPKSRKALAKYYSYENHKLTEKVYIFLNEGCYYC
jgi:tyrosine aminotransferase